MPFFSNIATVATYESKLLLRGNFFKIFSLLAVLVIGLMNYLFLVQNKVWDIISIPSNIPYQSLCIFNVFQAVIAVFLSSDFLKRDKKLDTCEVFYVRPLSNAEYVLGKTWGNLRLFLGLNIVILLETMIITAVSGVSEIDFSAYLIYLCILSLPTLIYIMGLSFFVMLLVRNQALTFVSVLGYVALTLFYLKEKFYNIFDFLGFGQPMMKSDITGFSNWEQILSLRLIYLFLGLGFIALTIRMYGRLPNSKQKAKLWTVVAIVFIALGVFNITRHLTGFKADQDLRKSYLAMNNKYVNAPVIEVDSFDIKLTQLTEQIEVNVRIKGRADELSDSFIFTLNPSLQIAAVRDNKTNEPLSFKHIKQIVEIRTKQPLKKATEIDWSFSYKGGIDELLCYLDIEDEEYEKIISQVMLNRPKKYAFVSADYLLLTPESYWYPRPGTGFSTESTKWIRSFFSHFSTEIHTQNGLFALAQGDSVSFSDQNYKYKTDKPILGLTAIVGNYEKRSVKVDSVNFSLLTFKGHDYFKSITDSIQDTIPALIKNMKQSIEAGKSLDYPFSRFSLVEVPVQYTTYARQWSSVQDCMQPEIVLVGEKGTSSYNFNLLGNYENMKRWQKWIQQKKTEKEMRIETVILCFSFFNLPEHSTGINYQGRNGMSIDNKENPFYIYPQLFNFKFNVVSSDWDIVNKIIENYLLNAESLSYIRNFNGISQEEEANLYLSEESLRTILAGNRTSTIKRNAIKQKSKELFKYLEKKSSAKDVKDSLLNYLNRNQMKNIPFDSLLQYLGRAMNEDLISYMPVWGDSVRYGEYLFPQPKTTKLTGRESDVYEHIVQLQNISPYGNIAYLNIRLANDKNKTEVLYLNGGEAKEYVFQTQDPPVLYELHTIVSKNIPLDLKYNVRNIESEKRSVKPEGERVINSLTLEDPRDIIVDNEDEELFTPSETEPVGFIATWLWQKHTSASKYSGFMFWNPPMKWIITTGIAYYGKTQHSAHIIKSGSGKVYAQWKVPVPEEGLYDVYYYVSKPEDLNWNYREKPEYRFLIDGGDGGQESYLDLRKAKEGWDHLGAYSVDRDTAVIRLYDDVKLNALTADAVKLVKRY